MKCPKCQFDNPDGLLFCGKCGAKLERICPSCNFINPPEFRFCGKCGQKLEEVVTEKIEPSIEGERKQVTVLFSDLSGYTAVSERLDPEEVKNIMSQIFGEVTQVVAKYDGSIQKFIGDAVVVFFGVPKAHEDDPVRAIRALVSMSTHAELGRCYLKKGKLSQALVALEESQQLRKEKKQRGLHATGPCNGLAEAYLVAVEQSNQSDKQSWLKKAGRACRAALKQGKVFRPGLPEAMRLQGTYEWLREKPTSAQKWWQKSLKMADEMGMRYDLGMTYLEMGQRLKERTHLEKAESIFAEIGAEWDLGQTRKLLKLYGALYSGPEKTG